MSGTFLVFCLIIKKVAPVDAIGFHHIQPIIHVDWSNMDTRKQHFLIRVSIATQVRSLTLYEEIHPLNLKEKPKAYRLFM
jgi:hypothetical protein